MARWNALCLHLPASWHINLRLNAKFSRYIACLIIGLACMGLILIVYLEFRMTQILDDPLNELINKYELLEVTDIKDKNLYYGVVVDAGSSGTRVYVYFWPRHIGDTNKLLKIHQMRDSHRKPVVMKIKPGLATLANNPSEASEYLKPLLDYAASHIPKAKLPESPLYILATAGMRMLPLSQQEAILQDLKTDIPKDYKFLFSDPQVEVISGKQEGVYAWIGINYVLGRFDHGDDSDPMVEVDVTGESGPISVLRKRTVGILDMGGGSAQIAFEVPHTVSFNKPGPEEDVAKGMLAEFNLGCDVHKIEHVYRVYVTTFLGFGGNAARTRYEKALLNASLPVNKSIANSPGLQEKSAISDPCLPVNMQDQVSHNSQTIHLKGTGDFKQCQASLVPLLNLSSPCAKQPCSFNGVFQPEIEFRNSEFYGFSEYWYCMEDVLRIGGMYNYVKFELAAKDYCATRWSLIQEHYVKGLYTKADAHRIKYQCFKSAWITTVLHKGFRFPEDYHYLRTASLIQDKEVQWTLGAILHRTRFLPLREIQQGAFQKQVPPPWVHATQISNQYIFITCFVIVCIFIMLYVRWLRGMGPRRIYRVPTMAYFMTEEGQIQDGIQETGAVMLP
ncbi:ectonucleoside triphosphate diphosphohydrolase 4-like isoform X1 [Asterias rubens]|uniref:ectonucleoside triphosphate diphosphohydrolase 4-like isoform X1 n=1 Tax=Asterias rubens TaxID=7604 RepID=UPI0014557A27|nr:ectonucleoside triphosphate diphosphohydrolase 4-like isoform X1 [Asterias rubens]